MYQVRKWRGSLLVLLMLSIMTSCVTKAPEYPDLEGFWKLERIENNQTGEVVVPNRLYWSLQLGIIKLNDRGSYTHTQVIGAYLYDEQARTLSMPEMFVGVRDAQPSQLIPYGIPDVGVVFDVQLCDGNRMILRCDEFTVYLGAF